MKLTILTLCLCILQVSASITTRGQNFDLQVKDQTLKEVLKEIENKTTYRFFYNDVVLDLNKLVSLNLNNKNIQQVLDELLNNSDASFKILNNNLIVIAPAMELQQTTVKGSVTDASSGEKLIGVTVLVEGTTTGVTTDVNGQFSIDVSKSDAVLIFSYVGYVTERVQFQGQKTLDVKLVADVKTLDEVVVVGYGTQKKKDITSAITIVDAKALAKTPVANVSTALQGQTAGVEVQNNTGNPGSLPTIRIRGVSSINNTDPLYVVDGIPQGANAYINTQDIESMQVLKDAASAAIYGSRGANGVIIVTTKGGKTGAPKVRYSGYYGVQKAWKTLPVLNMRQWAQVVTENNTAGGKPIPTLATEILANPTATSYPDWDGKEYNYQDLLFQNAPIYENNIDISGGTKNGNYYFSANQLKQEGIEIATPYYRYTVRMNSNWQSNKFKFGENIQFMYDKQRLPINPTGRDMLQEAIKMTPNVNPYNPNAQGGYSNYNTSVVGHDASNVIGFANRNLNFNYNKRFNGSVYMSYEVIKGLELRSTLGVSNSDFINTNLALQTDMPPKNIPNTTLSNGESQWIGWTWENMATYHKIFGDHDVTLMGAYTSEYTLNTGFTASGTNISTETNDILAMVTSGQAVGGNSQEFARISYLGRVMYSYKGKYMLTANFRRDGSARFGNGNKWGSFPSASVAWRLSEESFMKGIEQISNFKIRTSYGITGNDNPVNPYQYISGLSSGQDYDFNNSRYSGVSVTGFNNAALTWETVKQLDAGIDVGLFKGALELTADYYKKNTVDMLLDVPLPGSTGNSGNIKKNLGKVLNRGFELSATVHKNVGGLEISVTGNLSTLHNEVTDLNKQAIVSGTTEPGNATRTVENQPIGEFYGYRVLGVFPDQAAINAYKNGSGQLLQPTAAPGDIKWADINGDGVIDAKDQYYMGSPIPTSYYGLTINLNYKGFDLSLFFQGVQGNKIFGGMEAWMSGMHNNFNVGTEALDRWTPTHTITSVPRAVRGDPNGNILKVSDRYIKDGKYLRLKNAVLGYTIPKKVIEKVKLSNLRVYVTGRNLITWTKYPFFDPEIGGNNLSRGIDNGYYPQARTIIMGVQVDF